MGNLDKELFANKGLSFMFAPFLMGDDWGEGITEFTNQIIFKFSCCGNCDLYAIKGAVKVEVEFNGQVDGVNLAIAGCCAFHDTGLGCHVPASFSRLCHSFAKSLSSSSLSDFFDFDSGLAGIFVLVFFVVDLEVLFMSPSVLRAK